ncbi:hypothetical protein [Streptomyces sp. MP131-18]|uniref:hypothetical protein n=1 Tax=Streptomyces sp. MP131-18 TaxID=1857892 RepID=UPI0009C7CAFC|nr:hypothetical protein [Streptomyces sp. MP131-18]ONK09252.1 hypothetical protein STBA_71070 [Streptomyces sp. MP131-18]
MSSEVTWGGRWECDGCAAAGTEELWDDEDSPGAGHDCGEDGDVSWYGEWYCHDCGTSGDAYWADGSETWSNHDCDQDEDELEEAAA